MSPGVSKTEILIALRHSVRLQSHYAKLLNVWDQGRRISFETAEAWIARLRETGHLPKRPKGRKQRATGYQPQGINPTDPPKRP